MEPVDTPDVPRAVAVVRDFVNTTDRETATDDLTTPAELTRYLVAQGLMPRASRATAADLELALRLRSALRQALEQNHAGDPSRSALPDALAEHPVTLAWAAEGAVVTTSAPGVPGALARIAIAVHEATTGGLWRRLKICAYDGCEWAYYDQSKNLSRSWCEYGCGNKVKTRAYRARKAAASVG